MYSPLNTIKNNFIYLISIKMTIGFYKIKKHNKKQNKTH